MSRHPRRKENQLQGPWKSIHGGIWLLGLAFLFMTGFWWPGILILVALSMALEGLFTLLAGPTGQPTPQPVSAAPDPPPPPPPPVPEHPVDLLPSSCSRCGGPVRAREVVWTGRRTAECAYCGTGLTLKSE